jgi:hypothetical protein
MKGDHLGSFTSRDDNWHCAAAVCDLLCTHASANCCLYFCAGNCTSLTFEARIKFPAVLGTRGGLRLLPEPQDQPANAPRCELSDECGKYGKVE